MQGGAHAPQPRPHLSRSQPVCASQRLPSSYTPCVPGAGWSCGDEVDGRDLAAVRRLEQARLDRLASRGPPAPPPTPTVITALPAHLSAATLGSAVLLVDKPPDWECDEVARAVRWALKPPRGVRLGWVGLLEPLASGLVVVLLGQATALTGALQGVPATYMGTISLGTTTDTWDACGRAVAVAPWGHITDADIRAAASRLVGEQLAVPPPASAVKVAGRTLHDLARRRPDAQLEPRAVRVTSLAVERTEPGGRELRFTAAFAGTGYPRRPPVQPAPRVTGRVQRGARVAAGGAAAHAAPPAGALT